MANRNRLHPKDSQRNFFVKRIWEHLRKELNNKQSRSQERKLGKKPTRKDFEEFGNL